MSTSENRLVRIIRLTGRIQVVTGLRIGGSQETMEISGLDNPILRNPWNAEPYIPGSSLKGRMRSLAEWYFGELPPGGELTRVNPTQSPKTTAVFGMSAAKRSEDESAYRRGPTRLIVRDAHMSNASRKDKERGRILTEVKSENSINRYTSVANPRPIERIVPGVEFDMEILYRVFSINGDEGIEDLDRFDSVVLTSLALVEADALGGGSSRGNGKIRFVELRKDEHPIELPILDFAGAKVS